VPTVVLAPALARWLTPAPSPRGEVRCDLPGGTARELLTALFAAHPAIRPYVVDETGTLRHHVVAFLDGTALADKHALADPVSAGGELYLFQALSGG
jgi:hypothetical protein